MFCKEIIFVMYYRGLAPVTAGKGESYWVCLGKERQENQHQLYQSACGPIGVLPLSMSKAIVRIPGSRVHPGGIIPSNCSSDVAQLRTLPFGDTN